MTRSRFLQIAFWLAAAFAFYMATTPHPPEVVELNDKFQHMLAFAVLTVLALAAYPRIRVLYPVLGLSAFGGLIEVVQSIPSLHRDASLFDWLADIAAVLGAFALVLAVRHLLLRKPQS